MFLQQIINGLTLGCLYSLLALGYTLIFGILQVIFFAQGELSMLGAFIAIGGTSFLFNLGLQSSNKLYILLLIFPLSIFGTIVVGILSERVALQPLRTSPRVMGLITSLGVSIVLQNVVFLGIGSRNFIFPNIFPSKTYFFGIASFSLLQVIIVCFSAALMLTVYFFINRTKFGLAIKACSEDKKVAGLMGIDVNKAILLTFVTGSVLAACAGIMMASYYGIAKYDMGFVPGIKAFTAAILGGIGNILGGMLGGLVIGIVESLGAGYLSAEYKDFFTFLILIAVLVFSPHGILGERVPREE